MPKMTENNSPLAEMIRRRGMTTEEAFKASGLSRRTFEILLGGGVTLPQLALQVGKALRLTQAEVKMLGKPLDKARWDAQKLPYKPVDVDPHWYRKVGKTQDSYEMWLDKGALAQVLLERGIYYSLFYQEHKELLNVNQGRPEKRREVIHSIAALLGVPPERLETPERLRGHTRKRFLVHQGKLEAAMKRRRMDRMALAKAIWTQGEEDRNPTRRMVTLWEMIENGETVTEWAVERIAAALGVEVTDFAEVRMQQRKW